MEIDTSALDVRDRYKLLIGCIVPRPIAFVSTVSPDGRANLAPFSFFNGVGSNPMTLLFCPGNKPDGSEKDTLRKDDAVKFAKDGADFAINFTSSDAGKKSFTATFKFAVCTDENCAPQTETLAFDVDVK